MIDRIKMPLSVYVMYHFDNKTGKEVYTDIYHLLCRDSEQPLTDGMDIPVFLRTGGNGKQIPDIDFEQSSKTAIFLLVDELMYCSSSWKVYIEKLIAATNDDVKIYPIALFKYAYDIDKSLQKSQFVTLKTHSIKDNWNEFQTRIFDDLIRLINNKGKDKLKLFISHSKKDHDKLGETRAKELRDYLRSDTKLDSFFDANDIIDGYDFEDQIKKNVEKSILIILESNTYSEREWCRIEALAGKRHKIPCIVVNLIDGLVKRSFPYLGNTPVVRFSNNWNEIINVLLKTSLSQYFQEQLLLEIKTIIKGDTYSILPFSPELLSFSLIKGTKTVLYPEPPLGTEEIEFLKLYEDSVEFITPVQAFSILSKGLKDKKIAISISDSADISDFGGAEPLIRDITIEISRHILIAGGKLVYGGDLRSQGFTELFRELSCQYGLLEKSDRNAKYFINYFAWPIHLNLVPTQITDFEYSRVEIVKVQEPDICPPDIKNDFLPPTTLKNNYLWAKSLSKMRAQMEENVDARVVLGGGTFGFKGKCAGIVEEFIEAKKRHHPIYLLGGFGGVTKVIVDILQKGDSADFLYEQAQRESSYLEFMKYYNSQYVDDQIDYRAIASTVLENGIAGLNNGLTVEENQILFVSTNVMEIVALVLKGLNNKLK